MTCVFVVCLQPDQPLSGVHYLSIIYLFLFNLSWVPINLVSKHDHQQRSSREIGVGNARAEKRNAEDESKVTIQFCELRELFSKSLERGGPSTTKEKGSFQMAEENSSKHSNESKGSGGFAKLDFPHYSGDDPTVWLDQLVQYFDYKQTSEDQRVSLAAFHLESEANQCWKWMKKVYKEELLPITWEVFKRELLIRFGPTKVEDYDEALSRIQQDETLREYQQEFECLANRVNGWPQKALVGTFLGGLKQEIVSALRMFKLKTLCDAIELVQMRDDNLLKTRGLHEMKRRNNKTLTPCNNRRPTHLLHGRIPLGMLRSSHGNR